MKKIVFIVLFSSMLSCKNESPILGKWQVQSKFYKATYLVHESDGRTKVSVLTYDDGTTQFETENTDTYVLYANLRKTNDGYVDAMSGATSSKSPEKEASFTIQGDDTLLVTSYVLGKPLTEKWIKIN